MSNLAKLDFCVYTYKDQVSGERLHGHWSSGSCSRYLQVVKGSDQFQLRKSGDIAFLKAQWQLNP